MALNNTGAISLGGATTGQSVNLELGLSATAQISFNDTAVRTLTGTTAGAALVMPTQFYGHGTAVFTVSGSYTVPASYTSITIEAWGGGGGGQALNANNTGSTHGSSGIASTVSGTGLTSMSAGGGAGSSTRTGGTATGGNVSNVTGGSGSNTIGDGGKAPNGSINGGNGGTYGGNGFVPGGGGGGAYALIGCIDRFGSGGGAGAYSKTVITTLTPGTILSIAVGTGGAGGANSNPGGAGAVGRVIIKAT